MWSFSNHTISHTLHSYCTALTASLPYMQPLPSYRNCKAPPLHSHKRFFPIIPLHGRFGALCICSIHTLLSSYSTALRGWGCCSWPNTYPLTHYPTALVVWCSCSLSSWHFTTVPFSYPAHQHHCTAGVRILTALLTFPCPGAGPMMKQGSSCLLCSLLQPSNTTSPNVQESCHFRDHITIQSHPCSDEEGLLLFIPSTYMAQSLTLMMWV